MVFGLVTMCALDLEVHTTCDNILLGCTTCEISYFAQQCALEVLDGMCRLMVVVDNNPWHVRKTYDST